MVIVAGILLIVPEVVHKCVFIFQLWLQMILPTSVSNSTAFLLLYGRYCESPAPIEYRQMLLYGLPPQGVFQQLRQSFNKWLICPAHFTSFCFNEWKLRVFFQFSSCPSMNGNSNLASEKFPSTNSEDFWFGGAKSQLAVTIVGARWARAAPVRFSISMSWRHHWLVFPKVGCNLSV